MRLGMPPQASDTEGTLALQCGQVLRNLWFTTPASVDLGKRGGERFRRLIPLNRLARRAKRVGQRGALWASGKG